MNACSTIHAGGAACAALTLLLLAALCAFPVSAQAAEDPGAVALEPPTVIAPPGPEYAGSKRVFQGIPGLERAANGRLWATWYGGGPTEGPWNYCMLVTSGDDGKTWSDLKLVVDIPQNKVRAFDPCLWVDPTGRLWFFWAQAYEFWDGRAGVWAIVTDNPGEENPTWSKPRRLCDGIMMNKPTVLSTGEWLLPAAIWSLEPRTTDKAYSHDITDTTGSWVVCSTDKGKTWTPRGRSIVADRACDEHMLVERRDGVLWKIVRTKTGLGEAFSSDRGKTWTKNDTAKTVTHIPHARFFIRRLASGKLLMVKHNSPDMKTRSHLMAYLSDDDGKTWYGELLLDERKYVSYPDGVQAPDGTIYMIYDWERRAPGAMSIFMATFTEKDVAAGKCVSDKARLRVLVNKATGVAPPKVLDLSKANLSDNKDGQPLLTGEAAVLEAQGCKTDTYRKGAMLFTNRKYVVHDEHKVLSGKTFICSSIDRDEAICREAGVVTVITPLPNRNGDSVSEALLKQGFKKARVPEFLLFGQIANNLCSVYQKRMEKDKKIVLGKWGVVIF
jgi:BNR repeat protein